MPLRKATIQDAGRRDHLVRKGAEALALGDRKEALARYRAALECDPEDNEVRMIAAELEAACGSPRRAATALAELLDRKPAHPEAWNLLGVLCFDNDERQVAERCWKRALAIAPAYESPRRNLARAGSVPRSAGRPSLLGKERIGKLLGRRPVRLSVCLIVRDEAELLPGCLESVAGVADEMVLVDTGSTDPTRAIAERAGARVYPRPWTDDFSEARNAVLKRARGDWVLMIDADERLLPEDAAPLREFIESPGCDYATVAIESEIGSDVFATRAIRLFRNYATLCYSGRVHEQLGASLRPMEKRFGLRAGEAPIRLRHLGYAPEIFARRDKADRNTRLMETELRDNPGNAYAHLKQGEWLFGQRRFEEAAGPIDQAWRLTDQAVREGQPASLLEEPATLRAACALARNDHDTVLETTGRFHEASEPTANTLYLEGVSLWELEREGAEDRLRGALRLEERSRELFTLPAIRGATPRFILGALALARGEAAGARSLFEDALAREPDHRESRLGLAEAEFHEGRPEKAVSVLAAMLQENPADLPAWRAGGVILAASPGREEAARAWLEAASTAFPGDEILDRLASDLCDRAVVAG